MTSIYEATVLKEGETVRWNCQVLKWPLEGEDVEKVSIERRLE